MPVPLPRGDLSLHPPTADEVALVSRGIVGAVAPPGGLTEVQRLLLGAVMQAMTGYPADFDRPPLSPDEAREVLAGRTPEFRSRIVQVMVLCALVLRPLPPEV